MLSKEQILAADDTRIEEVQVPEWGGSVFVRNMLGEERDAIEDSIRNPDGTADLSNYRAKVCARAICDEKGKRLFDDTDVRALGRKSGAALNRVYEAAQKLNGLREKDVEDKAKNS